MHGLGADLEQVRITSIRYTYLKYTLKFLKMYFKYTLCRQFGADTFIFLSKNKLN